MYNITEANLLAKYLHFLDVDYHFHVSEIFGLKYFY